MWSTQFAKGMHCAVENGAKHFYTSPDVFPNLNMSYSQGVRGVTTGGARVAQFPGRQITMGAVPQKFPLPYRRGRSYHCGGTELLREAPKSPNNVTSTFFNTVNLLPKKLRFDHGGAKLDFCPGRHLTSLRPCLQCKVNND